MVAILLELIGLIVVCALVLKCLICVADWVLFRLVKPKEGAAHDVEPLEKPTYGERSNVDEPKIIKPCAYDALNPKQLVKGITDGWIERLTDNYRRRDDGTNHQPSVPVNTLVDDGLNNPAPSHGPFHLFARILQRLLRRKQPSENVTLLRGVPRGPDGPLSFSSPSP